jgi:thymidylate synthase (FAD)
MKTRLIWITPDAEKIVAYCARVSNPGNQDNPDIVGLIKYCAREDHWSIFEQANACFEIEAPRAITAQIARHRSFSFQEFSQRYAKVQEFAEVEVRRQDLKNRQNSIDDLPEDVKGWWSRECNRLKGEVMEVYEKAIAIGVAKECARMILPMSSMSRMYMNGTLRSWIHYLDVRTKEGTQKEHRDIAIEIRKTLLESLPTVGLAVGWNEPLEGEWEDGG